MVPVVSTARELALIVPRIEAAVKEVLAEAGVEVRLLPIFYLSVFCVYVCLGCAHNFFVLCWIASRGGFFLCCGGGPPPYARDAQLSLLIC